MWSFGSTNVPRIPTLQKKVCNFVGGVMSPILCNVYMDRLDRYVHHTLIPEYTRGNRRKTHPEYERLRSLGKYYRTRGQPDKAAILRKQAPAYPSGNPHDQDYRRLRYVRYADGTPVQA